MSQTRVSSCHYSLGLYERTGLVLYPPAETYWLGEGKLIPLVGVIELQSVLGDEKFQQVFLHPAPKHN